MSFFPQITAFLNIFLLQSWINLFICIVHKNDINLKHNLRNIFVSEKLTNFPCAHDGVQTSGLWISSPTLY